MAWIKRKLPWWPVFAALVLAVCALTVYRGADTLLAAQAELDRVLAVNQELDRNNRALYHQVQRLRNDPHALEKACRREMGLVRPDEVVYNVAAVGGRE